MARNGSGTYVKVNTFVAGNSITASGHNQNWDDITSEMTNSVAADGQTTMTGPLKASSGTAANPSHTFGADTDTGLYRSGANELSAAAGGSQIAAISSAGIDIKTGTLKLAGTTVFPVPTAQIADDAVTYAKIANVGASRLVGNPTGGAADLSEISLGSALEFSGTSVNLSAARRTLPTRQTFTSGSGTYTTPANVLYIHVRMVGGGGGGAGSGSGAGNGGTGGNTTFSTFTASGGSGGSGASGTSNAGGAGGTASGGTINLTGAPGNGAISTAAAQNMGAAGGGSAFFGGAGAMVNGGQSAGITNTGGGGGGGSFAGTTASGAGGGGGGSCEGWINSPAATYSYAVGAAGTAGTIGSGGNAGGAGGSGYIIVEEFYN